MDVWLKAPNGHVIGFTLPLHPTIERQWRDGILSRVNEDGSLYGDPSEGLSDAGEPTEGSVAEQSGEPAWPVRPALNAPKSEWAAHAEALGLDPAGKTKAQIVEMVTPPEETPPEV